MEKQRKPMTATFLLSLAIHGALIAGFGSIVVFQYFKRPPVQFKTPPPPQIQKIDPRKLEYKVKMQQSQKKSGRPSVSPRLTSAGVGAISLPDIKSTMAPTPNKVLSNLASFG